MESNRTSGGESSPLALIISVPIPHLKANLRKVKI
jgi:hypothetical protein